ncbi:MAG: hypothetical protein EKK63_12655 [Acinetobacter sp.]|uniref:hypothetical protein n=1 Tax=Acinetobacter sp. TaxID=472 RepID=UPI000F9230F6|nr:hypothetical protein [Acinetobacter sp.]RUP38224.1 MAG: hypothetical protein EKK63_12655 [Acinetobacter sp.]
MFETFNTVESSIFIVELAPPHERLMIQFVPDEINMPRTAEGGSFTVVGRNHKKFHYTSGSEPLNMELQFFADDDKREDVKKAIDWLKSLTMNDGTNAKFRNVKIIMGKMFEDEIFRVVSVSPVMSNFDSAHDWLPLQARVNIVMELDPQKNMTIKDRRK